MMPDKARAERLSAYCKQFDHGAPEWGVDECTMFAARWLEAESGLIIPRTQFRGEAQARSIIEFEGGLTNIFASRLSEIGLRQTYMPRLGDVGVVPTTRHGDIGVIFCAAGSVAWRMSQGVRFFMPRRFSVAYTVPDKGD